MTDTTQSASFRDRVRKWIPGIITGSADNDPAGITTYAVSGAQFGYHQLWLLILSTPMLIAVQSMSARIGDVTRKGLMTVIRERFHPGFVYITLIILVISNVATLSADIMAVAEAFGLTTGLRSTYFIIPIALIALAMMIFEDFKRIEKVFLVLSLVFFAYVASAIISGPDWAVVFRAIILPQISFDNEFLVTGLGLMGTTITPFLFFWQSRTHVEEHETKKELREDAKNEDRRLAPGFIYSNMISFFIIVSTATVFHGRGLTGIATATDAALALEPVAGPLAKTVFALGIIGAGFLAIPVLGIATAYAVSEVFKWRESLSLSFRQAKGFYGVLIASICAGVAVAFMGIDPVSALLYSQVLNGMLSPVLIVLLLILTNDRKLMGTAGNGIIDNVLGIMAVTVMTAGTILLLAHFVLR
jgi:NRAMP (natural resistance-associated macrophage protein)-like metal ion transporter